MTGRRTLTLALASCAFAPAQVLPPPNIAAVVNPFTFDQRLSPISAAAVFGSNLGPPAGMPGQPPGLLVFVGNIQAPVIFSSAQQVNIQIPVELSPGPSNVLVEYQGRRSALFPIMLALYSPGIPSQNLGGTGQGFFLRQNGTLVTAANAPGPGEVVSLAEATGLGPTNPPAQTGVPASQPTPTVTQPIVAVSGRPASLIYAGLALIPRPGAYAVIFQLPGDLAPGDHAVSLSIAGIPSNTVTIPVAIRGLALTQSGFTFQAVEGGGAPAPKSFRVQAGVTVPLAFTISPSTVTGGNWLLVTPTSGVVTPNQAPPTVTVSVDASRLTAGDYFGSIRVDAPGATNTPQFITVVLNIAPANGNPGPTVEPTGLVFVAVIAAAAPAPQTTRITNVTTRPTAFAVTPAVVGSTNWFAAAPLNGMVAPGQPVDIGVTPNVAGLAAGVYRGSLTIAFPQDQAVRVVELLLVVTPVAPSATATEDTVTGRETSHTCTPTRLLPVFTLLGRNFNAPTALPTPIESQVVDDCGNPLRAGTVVATFSNGDPPLPLVAQRDGRWSGTWVARNPRTATVTVTLTADQQIPRLTGTVDVGGNTPENPDAPLVNSRGVVSAASYSPSAVPSPGDFVAVFGGRLADRPEVAQSLPLPFQLAGASVTMGGRPLPVYFTSAGQINAIVPYELAANNTYQLIVRKGNRLSVPEPVTLAAAQPGVFTVDLTGRGQGHVYVFTSATDFFLADASGPARAGNVIVVYCSGLGSVDPPVTTGSAVPFDAPRLATATVTLTIGGVPAQLTFAGVTAGFAGLYQVNAVLPAGVTPGDAVPVVITAGGVPSPAATMAVR